jgi:hypothetical protein
MAAILLTGMRLFAEELTVKKVVIKEKQYASKKS